MAKLYFRYGTVGSGKTLNLLAVTHNYRKQNKKVWLVKPALDDRFGAEVVQSRAGLEQTADALLDDRTLLLFNHQPLAVADIPNFCPLHVPQVSCVVVDEAQFLSPSVIEQLHRLAWVANIPVICYGVKTDFRTNLFPGSQRLLELADAIEEVKTTCFYCNRKATLNLRLNDGKPTVSGAKVTLGGDETYRPVCKRCYADELASVGLVRTISCESSNSSLARNATESENTANGLI